MSAKHFKRKKTEQQSRLKKKVQQENKIQVYKVGINTKNKLNINRLHQLRLCPWFQSTIFNQ